ncbi:alpha-N-acetylglucosaminidase isoform X1 [Colletes gigas]|uniref:alpha-N-acetylglucosaminidase isoform X1 n=2 Tax=Colletes gigas TaxID=935657 RepID=UPI001C9B8B35|nr:alpha-N-acetylglucosaminidase isoform X1 [Colletes gigas]
MSAVRLLYTSCVIVFGLIVVCSQRIKQDAFQSTLGHIRPQTSPEVQIKAAEGVAQRLLGTERANLFVMIVDPDLGPIGKDTFTIRKTPLDQIEIVGTSGVTVAWGLHYYLKNYCNVHVSWEGSQLELPNTLPDVRVNVTSNDRFRYYQNVCTMGYSSAWWQWDQWERNIDWMALNGINLALAFNGQEAIWRKVYLKMNLTLHEINEHFGGPAFLPWIRMGNIRGLGGILSSNWHERSLRLQHRILQRMRDLGIIPVLPAFAGHVPRAISRLFPTANITKTDPWNHFSDKYCCPSLLEPTDPLFQVIGEKFLKTYIAEFGTDHVYNCDTFNENEPYNTELKYLRNMGRSVFSAMNSVDPEAVWIMQGWLFVHSMTFWTEPRVKAFLSSVPLGKMIVLDLQSEQFPQYNRFKSYYGHAFIWCMLHNFGGTLGMFGSAQIINHRVFEARNMNDSTMVGTGLTPEGINQNYVIYDLMNEMAYRQKRVNLDNWFENYASRRYGAWNEYTTKAWKSLRRTIYNFNGTGRVRGRYVITLRPSLKLTPWAWYDRASFFDAWYVFLQARHGRRNSTLYQHDVVDLTRQALQLKADDLYVHLTDAFKNTNITEFKSNANALIELFDDLESILASGRAFLLGTWLEEAKNITTNKAEKQLYEYNARNQITLWGPRGEIRDYANKQWSGVIMDYFKPRWVIFLTALETSLVKKTKLNVTEINENIFEMVEKPFTFSRKIYATEPKGDCIEIAMKILAKWYRPSKQHKRSSFRIKNLNERK